MQGEIAQAFVRIRPTTAGFQREAEGQIKHHLVDVGKTLGGVLAVGGAVQGIKALADAASTSDAAFAVLDRSIKNAGASTQIFGENIRQVLEHEARLKGFRSEDLAQSFARLVSVTHDTGKAFKDLGLAQDIARARGVDITLAAQAIARAEDGQVASLKRIGVTVPAVTSAYDALVKTHTQLLAAGVKFNAAQKAEYQQHLTTAKAADAHARQLSALDIITQKYGGTAKEFAGTGKGSFDRFSESMRQLEGTIGEVLLPGLTKAADGTAHLFETLRESGSAAEQARGVIHGIGDGIRILGDVAHIVGPPLGAIAHTLSAVTGGNVGSLVGIGVAIKGIGLASNLGAAAIGRAAVALEGFTGAQIAATGAKGADIAVAQADTAALIELAAATNAAAGAQLRLGGAASTATGALAAEAAAARGAAAASAEAAAAGGIRGAFSRAVGLNPVIQAGLAAGLVLEHFKGKAKAAQDEAAKDIEQIGTKRAAALAFYTHRVERLVEEGMSRIRARALAEQQTFDHLGVHINGVAGAAGKSDGPQTLKAQLAATKSELAAIAANVTTTRAQLSKATEDLRVAEENLADAIRQGNQQIQDSIRSAESNLFSIGDTLSSTIQEFLDKIGQLGSAATNPASATFKRLRDEIASGSAAPGAAKAAAEIANQIQESQAVQSQSKQKIQQQFADLIDEFNKGAISLATFNKRVAALLAADHISYKKAGQVLGVAFADGFKAQVEGLLAQAAAIAAVPSAKRAGITGLEPSIIRPLETIHQVQEQVAAAQRARDEKALEVAKDQRRLTSLEAAQARVIRQQTVQQTRLQQQMAGHLKSIDAESKRKGARDRRLDAERRRQQQREATSERSYHAKEAHDTAVIGGP